MSELVSLPPKWHTVARVAQLLATASGRFAY
jgi:hypothetical protein